MLPADVASFRVVGGQIVPDWLGPEDHPWLRDLLGRVQACVGLTTRELDLRLRTPLSRSAPPRRVRMAVEVLRRRIAGRSPTIEPTPAQVREALFRRSTVARRGAWARDSVVAETAASLGLAPAELERALFLDLPSERRVTLAEPLPGPAELALSTNLALAQALLQKATVMEIDAYGNSRDLVRHVRLRGLLCVARRLTGGIRLQVSGPFALFRRTTLYGRAYASVVPRLPWCERFALHARCTVRGASAALRLGPEDPIYPSVPPRQFDSRLEETFARDLARRFPEWGLTREPEPVEVAGTLVFPDFALYRVAEPDRRWLVEIVGFWTPEYLKSKLEHLRQTPGWLVAIDQRLNCAEDALPPSVGVVRFGRRLDPAAVIALAEQRPAGTRVSPESPEVVSLGPRSYYLDWAGHQPASDPVHARLAALVPGSPMELVARDGWLWVVDERGDPVAALCAAERDRWSPQLGRVLEVAVREVVVRTRAMSGPAFRDRLRVDQWRVPLVDLCCQCVP